MKGTRAKVDVGGVLQTGRGLDVREAIALPDFGEYRFPRPVEVVLGIERLGRGVELRGGILGEAEGECARCLGGVTLPLDVEVAETLEPDGGAGDPLGETNVLVGSELDLRDLVRQLIDSALPLALLCSEDCPGLCSDCGRSRNGECSCPTSEMNGDHG